MPTKKIIMIMAMAIAVLSLTVLAQRTTSIALDDGNEAILNDDSTWNFRREPLENPKDDIFITLRDNRILWLKTDFTYTFTRTMPKRNVSRIPRPKQYPNIAVLGRSSSPDLGIAASGVTNDAYTKATAEIRKHLPTQIHKDAQKFLQACIRDEVKEHELEQSHNQVKGSWVVESKLTIPHHRVKKIFDCLELQLEGS